MRTGKSRKSLTWALMFTLLLSTMVVWAGCDNGDNETLGVHALIQKYRPELVESVGIDVCTFCHSLQTEQWLQGQHGNAKVGGVVDIATEGHPDYTQFMDGSTVETVGGIACAECHDPQGDGQYLTPDLTGNQPRPVVGCESCHGGGAEHFGAGQIPYPSPDVERCAQCHQSGLDYGPDHSNGYDIHAFVPGDTRENVNGDDVFYVKAGDDHSCAGCHNAHTADNTPNQEWAESGHGDKHGEAWVHYNWKASNRQSCQRCHTSTGFMNFANSLIGGTTYVPANNDFSHLSTNQNETLYCWGCHAAVSLTPNGPTVANTDKFKDNFRDPGAFPLQYDAMSGNTAFPDLGASNVCIACHSGRESGANVDALANTVFDGVTVASSSGSTLVSVRNSHYLPAGGIIFREIGYEYYVHEGTAGSTTAPNYSDLSYFAHGKIGTPAAGSTINAIAGENGPCAGCHMHGSSGKHLFSPLEMDGDTAVGTSATCTACHNGIHELTIEEIEENEEYFHASLAFLKQLLLDLGLTLTDGHPYISGPELVWTNTYLGVPTASGDMGRDNMGAAFNYNTLHHEPGAFAHNRYYTKRLIYDSIDWLDNNALDQSVATALTDLADGNAGVLDGVTLTEAQTYLLKTSGGKTRP